MKQPGTYSGTLTRATLGKASNDSLQAVLRYNITHVEVDGAWQEIEPLDRTVFLSFNGKAKDYSKKKLEAIGFEGKFEQDGDQQLMVIPANPTSLTCKHDTWNGETKERWDIANWGGGGGGKPADDADLMTFQALWNN